MGYSTSRGRHSTNTMIFIRTPYAFVRTITQTINLRSDAVATDLKSRDLTSLCLTKTEPVSRLEVRGTVVRVHKAKEIELIERRQNVEENINDEQHNSVRLRQAPSVDMCQDEKQNDRRQQRQRRICQSYNKIIIFTIMTMVTQEEGSTTIYMPLKKLIRSMLLRPKDLPTKA